MRRDIPALPDLVFATAAEPVRLADWLPRPLELVGVNDDVLILRHGERLCQVRATVDLDLLRLSWTPLADDGCAGTLRVSPRGVGRSVVELDHEDEELAGRLLDALAEQVEATFIEG
ncbi:hypothetical protein ABZ816_07255 [Actinosynnema sp. NPDC047251]|uniref:hypothetical protein n=1 Tax=Saccharothrix espanaensis TaxID=103731 RepID=UPI0002DE33CF|nr:hypothetical protein [Saccharothrix espanaensis]